MVFPFQKNALNRSSFTHALVPNSKLQAGFFENIFPQDERRGETMICFIKSQSENMKMTWNIRLFMFCMIYDFYKCDGFTVL